MLPSNTSSFSDNAKLVLVTGPSGAGRSTAINALEDLGYEAIDNLPISLVGHVANPELMQKPLAIGLDSRNRDFSTQWVLNLLDELSRKENLQSELLFLTCEQKVLLLRYSETRRRHPLAPAETPLIGIEREFDLLAPVQAMANVLIDTSELTPHDLKSEVKKWFSGKGVQRLAISVHSFSYKRSLPIGVDTLIDCRFLSNPYWQPSLRAQNGKSEAVQLHVKNDERFELFFAKTLDLIKYLLPAYEAEGKSHFSIGFGCTGGRHRSVAVAELIREALAQSAWQVSIRHREMETRQL